MTAALEIRMYRDRLSADATLAMPLKAAHRTLYCYEGAVTAFGDKSLAQDEGIYGKAALPLVAGSRGADIWRWEIAAADVGPTLAEGPGITSELLLAGPIATVQTESDDEPWLMRLDSVAFPAGGCALRHVHRGPGIRCLVQGDIRIDAEGASHRFGAGAPWFETGPDPVFAQAADAPTRFVRCSVLPASLLGKSSIRYVDPADADRPKDQTYRSYVDQEIGRPTR